MDKLSQLFLYLPGILIFLAGSGQVRSWLRRRKPGAGTVAEVVSCNHVVKRDKQEREVYNYYNVTAEFTDPQTHHKVRRSFKSPVEYAQGQQVRVYREDGKEILTEKEEEGLFHPLALLIGGALLILLALFENKGQEVRAMVCLAAVLIGAGACLLWRFISLKKKNLQPVTAEVTDIYRRQISKETKILRGSKFTYYPIVKYTVNGRENIRRCNINSSSEKTFSAGDTMTLYYDESQDIVTERHAQAWMAVAGAVILAAGIAAGLSILSVLI